MRPPFLLFLRDSREVMLFPTLERLESAVEAPDVLAGVYEAFDSAGQHYHLVVDDHGLPNAIPGEVDIEQARQMILDFHSADNPEFTPDKDLAMLVSELKRFYCYRSG